MQDQQPALLLLQLLLLIAGSEGQICATSRSITLQPFGFLPAPSHGVNSSYAYLAFIMNVTGSGADSLQCSSVAASRNNSLLGMQKVQAAIWAVNTFKTRYSSQLPGVTVGALILDSCQSSSLAALQLSNLQTCETAYGSTSARVQPDNIYGFVGIETLTETNEILPMLRTIGKPALSYQLTADSYDNSPYPLLARLSPSDAEEAAAIAALVQSTGARYAQIVVSSSNSNRFLRMADTLQSRLSAAGICVVNRVNHTSTAASSVNSFAGVRPVVLLLSPAELTTFATQMLVLRPASGTFTWLLNSELRRAVEEIAVGRENFFAGAVTLEQMANATGYSSFQNYFKSLTPNIVSESQNPWFQAFWSRYFRCNLPGSSSSTYSSTCRYVNAEQNLQSTPRFDPLAAKVIQSVDLTLHSLELARQQLCGNSSSGLCTAFLRSTDRFHQIYSKLYNGSLSDAGFSQPQANGGPKNASLRVLNCQKLYPGHAWREVGMFESDSLQLRSSLQAYGTDERNTTWIGACNAACLAVCQPNFTTTTEMRTSAVTTEPMTSNTGMPGTLRRRNWIYALMVCAAVGIIVTVIFLIFIIKTVIALPPELKTFTNLWSGKVLLVIILIGYISLFAWVPWPTPESCGVIRFMVGFVYVSMFSILMVKILNLINEFLHPEYQLLLFAFAVAVQVATTVEWLILVPVGINYGSMSGSQCKYGFLNHLQTLVYCMLLIIICTILSIAAHAIRKNNRESIFIGCAAGISIPIWIAWSLVGSLNPGQDFEDASMAFGLFINLTLVLLVIFLPKIHRLRQLVKEETDSTMKNEDPIYVLAARAPSVRSDGPVIVATRPGSAQLVALPDFARTQSRSRPQSLAGDRLWPTAQNVSLPRDLDGAYQPQHPKAYSEYNGDRLRSDGQSAKQNSLPQRMSTIPPDNHDGIGNARQKLARLGFL